MRVPVDPNERSRDETRVSQGRESWQSRLGRWLLHLRYFSPMIYVLRPRRPIGRLPDPATPDAILHELSRLPISTWRYRWDPDDVRHLGPMAQDFAAAFGLGPDERVIIPTDAQGVALAAIKALNEKVDHLDARVRTLEGSD